MMSTESSEKPPMPAPEIIEELPRSTNIVRVPNSTLRLYVMSAEQKETLRKWGYFLFFVNSFIMVLTSALIAIALYIESYLDYFDPFLMIYIQSPGLTLIVMNCILLGTTIFGYYVWYQNDHYLWFGIALVAIIMFEARFIIAGYMYLDKAADHAGKSLSYAMESYSNNTYLKVSVDILQVSLKCCGKSDSSEWWYTPLGAIPWSCCPSSSVDSKNNCLIEVFEDSCFAKLTEIPKQGIFAVFSTLGVLIVLEVIMMLVLRIMYAISTIRRRRRRRS